jgi:hypothetical protein
MCSLGAVSRSSSSLHWRGHCLLGARRRIGPTRLRIRHPCARVTTARAIRTCFSMLRPISHREIACNLCLGRSLPPQYRALVAAIARCCRLANERVPTRRPSHCRQSDRYLCEDASGTGRSCPGLVESQWAVRRPTRAHYGERREHVQGRPTRPARGRAPVEVRPRRSGRTVSIRLHDGLHRSFGRVHMSA